jgi:sulfite reductase beta subunit-like hemoprotein
MSIADVTTSQQLIEQEYDRTVREDIELFRAQAADRAAGKITDDELRPHRLRRGVYSQRQDGVHMIRTKVPGGLLTSNQMRKMAQVADEFAGGKGHLTTRQNIQYHFVPLLRVADLLQALAEIRLTTREACYNTVRNVTASPLAGLHPEEPFDVQPYARRVAFAFLHKELTDNLPRKFKIAFECAEGVDTIAAAINDVGLTPLIKDGVKGFRMTVAGGLGPLPTESKVLHEFIPTDDLVRRLEAVIRVFNTHGNRGNKNKARLKFVMRERGFDWLKETIEQNYQDILRDGGIPMPDAVPENFGGYVSAKPPLASGDLLPVYEPESEAFRRWKETNVCAQKQKGYNIATVTIPQGNMSGDQMRGLADIADRAGDGFLRFSMRQNVIYGWVPDGALKKVYGALVGLNLAEAGADEVSDLITCPGAYSCNLALTKAMGLGAGVAPILRKYDDPEVRKLRINVSSCPNSCGQHWIGDFGFYGNARKVDGPDGQKHEVPYYMMLMGGTSEEFGVAVQSLPAKLVPAAIERVLDHYQQNRQPGEAFRAYVMRHKVETFKKLTADLTKPPIDNPEMFKDWGDDVEYSLQLGRGECAA